MVTRIGTSYSMDESQQTPQLEDQQRLDEHILSWAQHLINQMAAISQQLEK